MKLGILAIIAGLILIGLAVYPLYEFISGFTQHPLNITETQTTCNGTPGLLFNIKYNNEIEIYNASILLKLKYFNGSTSNNILFTGNLIPNETINKCIPIYYFENATKYEFTFAGKIANMYFFNLTEVNNVG
ncbi:hypothetical protein Calag_0543 [Caldisphaera lagunensis DSM 15908]|uniref:Archaeal flagellin-like protein n=1 Tax=Caldisphaera lagunensis (strain DSM 15908 / JCM 11604 / ANMR 0165 / IC-154) TaxID=1056495 RepID=L0A8U6_CALLD|nr:hypothetical protein [Caldisphaera lagunensis]AFZ70303.1 hypothetical protein Calag_0543 [Caldisphaera lagunensis DSM 15908]